MVQLIQVGMAKSFGIMFVEFLEKFEEKTGETTWIMALNALVTFTLGNAVMYVALSVCLL